MCVVTGAARGIGLAIAERFGQEGGRIACVDVSARRLEPAVDGPEEQGRSKPGPMASTSASAKTSTRCLRGSSDFAAPVAVLVNNAVWARFEPLAQIEPETVDRMFAVGVHGLIWTTQAAAPQMERRGGGSIVNLSSVSAFNPAKDLDCLFRIEGRRRRPLARVGDRAERQENPRQRHRARHDRHAGFECAVR